MVGHRFTLGSLVLVLALLGTVIAASAANGGTPDRASAWGARTAVGSSARCKKVVKGHAWKQGGRTGTLFTLEGDRASACTVGTLWMYRLTTPRVYKSPPGWFCLQQVANTNGVCTNGKTNAVFTWNYGRR